MATLLGHCWTRIFRKNMSRNQIERSQIRAMSREKTHNSDEALPHFKIKEIDKNLETDAGGDI